MSSDSARSSFTAEYHALLFAWLVRELIARVGEQRASPVIRKAVREYGIQRGRRMALRARGNGHDLSMLNYLAYAEWKAGKGEMVTNIVEKKPQVRARLPRCCWHTAWKEYDLMQYGRYYCQEVDAALVYGFNPELKLEIAAIKPDGVEECDFFFHGATLGPINMLKFLFRKLVKPGKSALMPWDYHTGHIYKTVGDVFIAEFGEDGRKSVDAAMEQFIEKYGKDAAEVIAQFKNTDFNELTAGA
jgi:hypothetical protein